MFVSSRVHLRQKIKGKYAVCIWWEKENTHHPALQRRVDCLSTEPTRLAHTQSLPSCWPEEAGTGWNEVRFRVMDDCEQVTGLMIMGLGFGAFAKAR